MVQAGRPAVRIDPANFQVKTDKYDVNGIEDAAHPEADRLGPLEQEESRFVRLESPETLKPPGPLFCRIAHQNDPDRSVRFLQCLSE